MPTFVIFKNSKVVETIQGADPAKLRKAVNNLAAEASGGEGFKQASFWLGVPPPKGYGDVTNQVDVKGLDLLNSDSNFGDVRTLFDPSKPNGGASVEGKGKDKATEGTDGKFDWVESDTDEQLMLFMPFQSTLKVHTLQITSLPANQTDDEDEEVPMRPKTIQVYSNRAHVLGFEEAEDIPATQTITLGARDWDQETGTASIPLRFVKFQNVTSLVIFIVEGDGEGEKTRIDRIRIIGETGEKREMGKLEKIGDEQGE
jgi:hypothetical protein